MSQILQMRKRLKSIQNIHKVTLAMETMAITGLRRIQRQNKISEEYAKKMAEVLSLVCANQKTPDALAARSGRTFLVFLSTRGFCGNFNNNLADYFKRTYHPQPEDKIYLLGPLGLRYLRRLNYPNIDTLKYAELGKLCLEEVNNSREIFIVYNKYISILKQEEAIWKLYPFEPTSQAQNLPLVYLEPEQLCDKILPLYINALLQAKKVETLLGEYCNRFHSMRSANDNAGVLIQDLKIELNKTRQSTITAELSEVVSAFEVMRGGR